MARRSDHRPEELKQLIRDAGCRHLAELGADNFSARQVADDIGYTVRTLYNVFGSHQNLLLDLHRQTLAECHVMIADALSHTRRNRLHVWVEALVDFATSHRNRWLAVSTLILKPETVRPPEMAKATEMLMQQLEAELEPFASGHSALLRRTAQTFWASLLGMLQLNLNSTFRGFALDDPKRLARDLIDTYLRGLKYAPPGFGRGK
jgi:AcrR family transcriptional regulator